MQVGSVDRQPSSNGNKKIAVLPNKTQVRAKKTKIDRPMKMRQ